MRIRQAVCQTSKRLKKRHINSPPHRGACAMTILRDKRHSKTRVRLNKLPRGFDKVANYVLVCAGSFFPIFFFPAGTTTDASTATSTQVGPPRQRGNPREGKMTTDVIATSPSDTNPQTRPIECTRARHHKVSLAYQDGLTSLDARFTSNVGIVDIHSFNQRPLRLEHENLT